VKCILCTGTGRVRRARPPWGSETCSRCGGTGRESGDHVFISAEDSLLARALRAERERDEAIRERDEARQRFDDGEMWEAIAELAPDPSGAFTLDERVAGLKTERDEAIRFIAACLDCGSLAHPKTDHEERLYLALALVADENLTDATYVLAWLVSGEPEECGLPYDDPDCACVEHAARRWFRKHREEYYRLDAEGAENDLDAADDTWYTPKEGEIVMARYHVEPSQPWIGPMTITGRETVFKLDRQDECFVADMKGERLVLNEFQWKFRPVDSGDNFSCEVKP